MVPVRPGGYCGSDLLGAVFGARWSALLQAMVSSAAMLAALGVSGGLTVAGVGAAAAPVGLG